MDDALKRKYLDILERVAWTFGEVFLAVWLSPVLADILNGSGTLGTVWAEVADTSVLNKAAVAGLGAAIAFIKTTGIAPFIGSKNTAATLPLSVDTPKVIEVGDPIESNLISDSNVEPDYPIATDHAVGVQIADASGNTISTDKGSAGIATPDGKHFREDDPEV